MYRAHRIKGHPMSTIGISASGGVRAPVSRVAIGDATMRHSAKATYEGMIARLNATARVPTFDVVVHAASSIQKSTRGRAAAPQTRVSTTAMETVVQAIRQMAPAFQPPRRADILGIAEIL